ncbi:mitochondrial ribosomal protein S25-domain-containing protein [Mycena crocata]|nr:mitochondrial ribosomal protein S25-domain-containing protein [Mycena crocata]
MGRRIASQVHHQVARLMRGDIISRPPKWYQPVLNFPPLPLPAKAPPTRTHYDQKMKPISPGKPQKLKRPENRPLPIHYIEDDIRRQFYSDHPFEAFRPSTLVEKGDIQLHEVNGKGWTRLRQRGRNPLPEDTIQFTLNLHQVHKLPLSQAYSRAVAQFRALRSEHHIATTFAAMEAEELGAIFVPGEIEHAFEKEKRALASWEKLSEMDEGELLARKRWRMIADGHAGETDWSKGVEYVKMWQAGNRVNYSPVMTRDVDADELDEFEDEEGEEGEEGDQSDEEPISYEEITSEVDAMTTEELEALVRENLGEDFVAYEDSPEHAESVEWEGEEGEWEEGEGEEEWEAGEAGEPEHLEDEESVSDPPRK